MSTAETVQFAIRNAGNQKAVVFIHGFHGDSHQTFGMLPAFLAGNPDCYSWDIYCFGYPSTLAPDVSGVWSADPDLTTLAGYLRTAVSVRYDGYKHIALIAHSMGGLIVQRALLNGDVVDRVSHVLLFGTPSNGLRKAGLGRIFKRQARDMTAGSPFVLDLRHDWKKTFGGRFPFAFRTVAGVRDEFVPTNTSVEPFPEQYRSYVAGNHLEMVKPQTTDGDTTLLVFHELAAAGGTSALPASISRPVSSHEKTIEELLPEKERLQTQQIVKLSLALELSGRQPEAIELLRSRHTNDTELTGVLAGRLKRLWLSDPETNANDGPEAQELYRSAFLQADGAGDHEQAFYNGINVAFMTLALGGRTDDVQRIARDVQAHCKLAKRGMWQLATSAESALYLGDTALALKGYTAALSERPDPREADSMLKQAVWATRLLNNPDAESRLHTLFDQAR